MQTFSPTLTTVSNIETPLHNLKRIAVPRAEYQAIGGSLPIRLKDAGVIGSVTVAGLTPELDHEYVVKGVESFLNK